MPIWTRIPLFISMRSRSESGSMEPKERGSMQIRSRVLENFKSQKFEFLHEKYFKKILGKKYLRFKKVQKPFWKAENQVYLFILIRFRKPGSGSAFPIRIRIQEQDRQIKAVCGNMHKPSPEHWKKSNFFYEKQLLVLNQIPESKMNRKRILRAIKHLWGQTLSLSAFKK